MRRFRDIIEDIKAPNPQALWLNKGELKFFGPKGWTSLIGEGNEDRQELEEKVDSLDKEMGEVKAAIEKYSNSLVYLNIGDSDEVKAKNLGNLSIITIGDPFQCEIDYGFGVGRMTSGGGFAHVTTSDGHEVFYDITIDGAVTRNSTYIKPNEPYTVMLSVSDIGVVLTDTVAASVQNAGEIVINGSTGSITYTRTSDSTSSAIYFTDDRKDGKITLLTYNVSSKIITSTISNPYLPAASLTTIGGVRKMSAIENIVAESATAESVATKLNDVLAALRVAGILNM